MDFLEVLDQVLDLLRTRGRVTYRALSLQYKLDDETMETLKAELLFTYPVVDEEGRGLAWSSESPSSLSNVHPETDKEKIYHATLRDGGVGTYSLDECLDDYRLALFAGFWRLIFTIGGGNLRLAEEAGFCKITLPRYCAAILDLNAGELLSEERL